MSLFRIEKQKMLAGSYITPMMPSLRQTGTPSALGWFATARRFLSISNRVVVDIVAVTVGARTQIGPAVRYTADHPRDPSVRRTGVEFGRPIRIGQDVWIGGGAIILPGATIGDNCRDRRGQRRHV